MFRYNQTTGVSVSTNSMYREFNSPTKNSSDEKSSYKLRKSAGVLQDRLQEALIMELNLNGEKKYYTMSLRGLYTRVMKVIVHRPTDNDKKNTREVIDNIYEQNSSTRIVAAKTVDQETDEQDKLEKSELNVIAEENSHSTSKRSFQSFHTSKQEQGHQQQHPPSFLPLPPPPKEIDKDSSFLKRPMGRAYSLTYDPKDPTNINHPTNSSDNKSAITSTTKNNNVSTTTTYRERLGGYLHPRDMRRLVTPFSSSFNEPELMIRRHVMLLNFDQLRAIVLRDRVLVFVPDGADSILDALERRIVGGYQALDNEVFGDPDLKKYSVNNLQELGHQHEKLSGNAFNDEWDDIQTQKWKDTAFELVAVDALLQTVCSIMSEDAQEQINVAKETMSILGGEARSDVPIHMSQEQLRKRKDKIKELGAQVKGFVRAMNLVLDEDEDMALMNLSRLVSHPERFIQPVSEEILNEESDEPELILEAYMQQGLSIVNGLELIQGKIESTEELLMMKLDTVRNRLLWINTVLSFVSICVASASLVGSIFGMNLINGYEESDTMFRKVVAGTIVGSAGMLLAFVYIFYIVGSVSVS